MCILSALSSDNTTSVKLAVIQFYKAKRAVTSATMTWPTERMSSMLVNPQTSKQYSNAAINLAKKNKSNSTASC